MCVTLSVFCNHSMSCGQRAASASVIATRYVDEFSVRSVRNLIGLVATSMVQYGVGEMEGALARSAK